MARVLICHVPKDGSIARDVGSALMGRGHFVSFDGEPDTPREDRPARVRHFEAVLVIWTETSAQSTGLADIARETMPLNLLVPVRAGDLDVSRLPLAFRKLNMMSPRDFDGLARVIARLSTAASSLREFAERDTPSKRNAQPSNTQAAKESHGAPDADRPVRETSPYRAPPGGKPPKPAADAASTPARQSARPFLTLPEVEADPTLATHKQAAAFGALKDRSGQKPATADDLARAIDGGLLVQDIPAVLALGVPATVELSLGPAYMMGVAEPAVAQQAGGAAQSLETLSISLMGDDEAFEIERKSARTQFVTRKLTLSVSETDSFGRWTWLVTPRATGSHDLVVRVSALLRDRHGVPSPVALPDRRVTVTVEAGQGAETAAPMAAWFRR
jgi:hypothetical protein